MIELYYWTTPNGHKITMFREEAGLPYIIEPVNRFPSIQARPATVRAYAKAQSINTQPTVTEEGKKVLFGQTAR